MQSEGGGSGVNEGCVLVENHPNDSRVKIREDGIVQTLSSRMGTGGNNTPMVMETYQQTTGALCASGYDKLGTQEAMNDMYVIQSSWDGSQVAPTLTANNAGGGQRMPDKDNFNAVISYGVDCYNQSQSEEQVKALTNKATDSDHIPCVYGVDSYNQVAEEELAETIRTNGGGDSSPKVCTYGLDRASFNQGKNAQFDFSVEEEKAQTLVSKGPGGYSKDSR